MKQFKSIAITLAVIGTIIWAIDNFRDIMEMHDTKILRIHEDSLFHYVMYQDSIEQAEDSMRIVSCPCDSIDIEAGNLSREYPNNADIK